MKKILLTILAASVGYYVHAQWALTGNPTSPPNNILGTTLNTPIRFHTANEMRMFLNGNVTNNINSQGLETRNGFLGLGRVMPGSPAGTWNTNGPISLLHLNGTEGATYGLFGYRNWMRNGIVFTNNSDMMFVGPRRTGADDITDAAIVWSDNATAQGGFGPDNLVFAFSNGDGSGGATDLTGNAPNGREIMRLTAVGNVGIGPRFTNTTQPQVQLHVNGENSVNTWIQVSNQSATGQNLADGALFGVANNTSTYLYNQENAPLLFSTNASSAQLSRERMRLTHIGAAGVPNTTAANHTRLAISADPVQPLTTPYSTVHIGYSLSGNATDGIRNWMDIGYLATENSDNVYLGLKDEGEDRKDAVLAWGDNQTDLINGSGPDNLRFIFTNSQFSLSPGTTEAKSDNGQEIARFTPACATCPVNTGSLGIGNFSPGSPNAPGTAYYVGATLDVDGDARIRTVTQNNALTQVLVRDPADFGRLHWRDASTFTGGGSGLGNDCGSTPNPLTTDRQIPLNNNDVYFTGQSLPTGGNTVNIGPNCGTTPTAKLNVVQNVGIPIAQGTVAASTSNRDISTEIGITYVGQYGEAIGYQQVERVNNIGGQFQASGAANNYGIRANVTVTGTPPAHIGNNGFGGYFTCTGLGSGNNGIVSEAYDGTFSNTGISAHAGTSGSNTSSFNRGGLFTASGNTETNTGIHCYGIFPGNQTPTSKAFGLFATVGHTVPLYTPLPGNVAIAVYGGVINPFPSGVPTYAGYFDGNVYINGPINGTGYASVSDAQFKTGVEDIAQASEIIAQLTPQTYHFIDGESIGMNFPTDRQYGFIAQEVETVLPELVHSVTKPAMLDSLGNVMKPEISYKSLDYLGFIALLTKDAQNKTQQINQLTQQLEELTERLNGCCNQTRSMVSEIPSTPPTGAIIQTRLQNADEPTLGQNIPNPFETSTRIPVYLPQTVGKAELLFYGNDGRVLQTVQINERGNVQVDVNSEALASGIYSYTLFTDGKPVETRKMIKR